ncbi:MAG: hypothetical protein HQM08_29715 [Candidatus Riflebacteria bacterium]|nr:hypothetical protein [Candidatus Riflebacteria bacterium]
MFKLQLSTDVSTIVSLHVQIPPVLANKLDKYFSKFQNMIPGVQLSKADAIRSLLTKAIDEDTYDTQRAIDIDEIRQTEIGWEDHDKVMMEIEKEEKLKSFPKIDG